VNELESLKFEAPNEGSVKPGEEAQAFPVPSASVSRPVSLGAFVHAPFCSDPKPVAHCACFANQGCSMCGWGMGSYPCACNREAYEKRLRDLSPMGGGPNPEAGRAR
jgi:hypothetical protein